MVSRVLVRFWAAFLLLHAAFRVTIVALSSAHLRAGSGQGGGSGEDGNSGLGAGRGEDADAAAVVHVEYPGSARRSPRPARPD